MYLPRVYAKTKFKSKSLKPRESTINKTPRKSYVICLLQGKEWNLESRDSKWEKKKEVDVSSRGQLKTKARIQELTI